MLKFSVGLDISAKKFHACISTIDQQQVVKVVATSNFGNNLKGFQLLHTWIKKHHASKNVPLVIVMEATGVYYEACALFLFKKAYSVSVILPNKAKKYLQSTGIKTKNDKVDAKGLSRMAAEQALPFWQPLNEFFFTLRSMTRQLQSLQEMKTGLTNQLLAFEVSIYQSSIVIKQLKEMVKTVEKQITAMSEAIENHLLSDEQVAVKVKQMCSIKGVGVATVAVVLAETNGFYLFENISQLISYTGYDVTQNQSGIKEGRTRISKRGNHRIRRTLHLPAFNMVRYKIPRFIELFERTYAKHHIKMKSYVAVQKRLLIILYTLWKKNESFNPIASGNHEPEPSFACIK